MTTATEPTETFDLTDSPETANTPAEETTTKPAKSKKTGGKKKTAAKKKTEDNGKRGRQKMGEKELRRPQLRVLLALSEAGADASGGIAASLTIEEIAKRAKISTAVVRMGLGAVSPEHRDSHDKTWGYKSLLSRGMVKVQSDERGNVYHLSALGQKTAETKDEVAAVKKIKVNPRGVEPAPKKKPVKKRRVKASQVGI